MINKTTITKYCKEFIARYPVTIEFSEHINNLDKLFIRLSKHTPSDLVWTAHTCETCVEYHGEGFVHVSLHKADSKFAGLEASNLLYRSDKWLNTSYN